MSLEEQKEIGTLRALGWSRMYVLVAKAWESLAVSLVALLLGMLAASVHTFAGGAALFAPVLRGWAVRAPSLDLTPSLDVPFLAAVAAATLLLPALGTLLASYRPPSGASDAAIRE